MIFYNKTRIKVLLKNKIRHILMHLYVSYDITKQAAADILYYKDFISTTILLIFLIINST